MGKLMDAIFPMIANYKMNKILRNKLNPKNEAGEDIEPEGVLDYVENPDALSLEILKEHYLNTQRAKDKFEDKAKTNIIGVSISITLIMGTYGVLSVLNDKYPYPVLSWILFALIVISVAYMLIAGILVIHLLIGENEIYVVKLNSFASDETILRDDYDKCIAQNQKKNIIRNNYVFTSYECMRNALVCLFVILILVAIPSSLPNNDAHEILIHTSQSYSFLFSSSVVDFIKDEELRTSVESAINSKIESTQLSDVSQAFGIIDNNNNLFIKFEVSDGSVKVLLIEPYTVP